MEFTADQQAFRQSVRDFVAKECPSDRVTEWDLKGEYPAELFSQMAKLGWVAVPFPVDHGGAGGSIVDMCILAEELSRASYDLATGLGMSSFMGLNILRHGTEDQISDVLVPALDGRSRLGICMTEPTAGSDAASIRLRAERTDTGWRLNGQKVFITGAHIPRTVLLVAARTDPDAAQHRGITVFLVPNDTPGITTRRLTMLGRNIIGTNEVFFDDVEVGPGAELGAVNAGWSVLKKGLLFERLYVAACYIGSAQTAVDEALTYASEREQFGRPIGDFQAIAHLLADMQTSVDAARLLVYDAAQRLAAGADAVRNVSQAKLFGAEMVQKVTAEAMQIFGGYGYVTDSVVQRHFRDARAASITAGTSQIQRNIIARSLGLGVR